MKRLHLLSMFCAALLFFPACQTKETPESGTMPSTGGTVSDSTMDTTTAATATAAQGDTGFAAKAAQTGMAEVEFGKLALQQSSNADVKSFAQKMIDDHTKVGEELKEVAASKGLDLPTALSAEHQAVRDKLIGLQGAEFDRAYMEGQVKDHETAVSDFDNEANTGKDADLKLWAVAKLPTLREHRQMAQDVAGKVGVLGTAPATGT